MILDVTELDKKLLIRALYDLASPVGVGVQEYNARKQSGQMVHDITDFDCDVLLAPFKDISRKEFDEAIKWLKEDGEDVNVLGSGMGDRVADYYNGIPLKLDLFRPYADFNKIFFSTEGYDLRNGFYLSLEVLIKYFPLDDFKVILKEYPDYLNLDDINNTYDFELGRFEALKTVVENLLPDGRVDVNVLKSINYFDSCFVGW
ncbi:hypothetical protein [Tenacibaculum sp. 190524A02b]|uniref:hypothetical protein n=1 Tax=Tenacibaculum vairaonense TaxID=3137860 RepID=UPI0031FACE09